MSRKTHYGDQAQVHNVALQEQAGKLVTKLIALSEGGKVTWEETADEDTFLATVTKFIVTVGSRTRERRFTMADRGGRTRARFSTVSAALSNKSTNAPAA